MNLTDERYNRYQLVREMMQSIEVVKHFDPRITAAISEEIRSTGRLMIAGEGSSRIFPAKNTVRKALSSDSGLFVHTEGSHQASGYDLSGFVVFCTSNSGRTKEVILLARKLAGSGNEKCYALTTNPGTPLEKECNKTFYLSCGLENSVAATKTVIEQALFYESILWHIAGKDRTQDCRLLSESIKGVLTHPVDQEIVALTARASTVYFAGFNDGVAEELSLKTNEIVRKKSVFLEGTLALHGIEETMGRDDVVIVIDPIEEEAGKFEEVLVHGVGLPVIAIASHPTAFRTIQVPHMGDLNTYLHLCAGWNLLVETALATGVNMDNPGFARKVGNEFKEE